MGRQGGQKEEKPCCAQAERATAQGEADANRARAGSLRQGNQELIAASTLMQNLPAIVAATAQSLAGANLTILNGTEGVNEVVAGVVGQGVAILDVLRKTAATPAGALAPAISDAVPAAGAIGTASGDGPQAGGTV